MSIGDQQAGTEQKDLKVFSYELIILHVCHSYLMDLDQGYITVMTDSLVDA